MKSLTFWQFNTILFYVFKNDRRPLETEFPFGGQSSSYVMTIKQLYLKHIQMLLEWSLLLTLHITFLQWYSSTRVSPLKAHSRGIEKK